MFRFRDSRTIRFTYLNHRGQTAVRTATVSGIFHGTTEHHPEPQWLMDGVDHDRAALRTYALKDMSDIVYLD